jgi:hypothetical protein
MTNATFEGFTSNVFAIFVRNRMESTDPHGYIVVPHSDELYEELHIRCEIIGRVPSAWLQLLKMQSRHHIPDV